MKGRSSFRGWNAAFRASPTASILVLCIATDPFEWTVGDAWWDVGVPETSPRPEVLAAHAEQLVGRERQRHGV
jgi:3D-(3,5/4)-trihydroxycyclohexane-1,2-dione acylhydrolase (decyclizing)